MLKLLFICLSFFFSLNSFSSLRVCSEDVYESFDPHQASSFVEKEIGWILTYETIVKYNPKNHELVPFLIKRWGASNENKVYTLYFDKEIPFISPKEVKKKYSFKAEDFIFSINLYLDKVKKGKVVDQYAKENIASVLLVDEKTVEINLKVSDPFFMHNLAEKMGVALSKDYYQDLRVKNKLSQFYKYPVSTGAYKIKKIKENEVNLVRFDNYHFGRPSLEEINFLTIKDESKRLSFVKTDVCEIGVNVPLDSDEKSHVNKEEIGFYLFLPPSSKLRRLDRPVFEVLNFMLLASKINPKLESSDSFVPSYSSLYESASYPSTFKSQGLKRLFKEKGISSVTIYFDDDVKRSVHSIPLFLKYLKETFKSYDIAISMGTKSSSDILLLKTNFNGFPERSLYSYLPSTHPNAKLWDKSTFAHLVKNFSKTVHLYPIGFMDVNHAVSKKIKKFYPFRSESFDLTTVKLKDN